MSVVEVDTKTEIVEVSPPSQDSIQIEEKTPSPEVVEVGGVVTIRQFVQPDEFSWEAGDTVIAYRVVTTDHDGRAVHCSADNPEHYDRAMGLSVQSGSEGDAIKIRTKGALTNPGWDWAPTTELFVGVDGQLTPDQVGVFSQYVGYAVNPTTVYINIGDAVMRA